MTYDPFRPASRIHVTYAGGGRPDLHAARDALVAEVSAPGGLATLRLGGTAAIGQNATVAEAVEEARECLDELATTIASGRGEGYYYRHDVLPLCEVWTFFTTHGVGEDASGAYFYLLADALGFDSVRAALAGPGGVVSGDA